jgi:bifunctional UDP-N-acetylglucosamine pyrophosphorylase/glucosamine-1-phosphate N-acetyltransferase
VVVGHRGEWVTKTLVDHAPASLSISFVEQPEQLGTGDAVAVGITGLPESLADADGDVVVLPGDTPLVRAPTLAALVRHHRDKGAAATLLTALLADPTGYDRVVRGKDDSVVSVVEGAEVGDADDVDEVATTIHCFRHTVMAPALRRLRPLGITGEHSLTGIYAVLHDAGYRVESLVTHDPMEAARINERWMRRGVTMWDPERTYVDASVHLEPDVVLLPGVVLQGDCRVGAGAEIGPDCHLVDTIVGEGATVTKTTAVRSDIGENARVGPFVSLDPGSEVAPGTKVEPFSRVNSPGVDRFDASS